MTSLKNSKIQIKYQQKEHTAELDQKIAQLHESNTQLDLEAEQTVEKMESETVILLRVMDGINGLTEKVKLLRHSYYVISHYVIGHFS